ncbi:hypothetical protein [Streptomyces sp. Ru73]|nr:hypothetical protein [Streptomyces sp. Ru73]
MARKKKQRQREDDLAKGDKVTWKSHGSEAVGTGCAHRHLAQ